MTKFDAILGEIKGVSEDLIFCRLGSYVLGGNMGGG